MEKLIGSGQTIIDSVDTDLSYRIFVILDFALHLLHASEADWEESNVEHEPELERPQFSDLIAECIEILTGMGKILESMATKVITGHEPLVLVEIEVVEESELKFVEDSKLET